MNPLQIYSKFGTPENLQKHMLRVAALASLILDNWGGKPVDNKAIIVTCLLHDIAKPISFDMSKQSKFVHSNEELLKLQKHHDDLIIKYGTDEHGALMKIVQEIGLNNNTQRLISNLLWHYSDRLIDANDIESLIPIYADMRISPKSVLTLNDRILELHARSPLANMEEMLQSAQKLEDILSGNTSLDLISITNEQVENRIENLIKESHLF